MQVCSRLRLRLDLISHSSILATAAEGEGSMKVGMSTEEDASYMTMGVRGEFTASVDIPPQLLSPSPPADGVTDGPSIRSLSAEHVGHCPLDTTHSPYDVV